MPAVPGEYTLVLVPRGGAQGSPLASLKATCVERKVPNKVHLPFSDESKIRAMTDAKSNYPNANAPVMVSGCDHTVTFSLPGGGASAANDSSADWVGIFDSSLRLVCGGQAWYRAHGNRQGGFLWAKEYIPASGVYFAALVPKAGSVDSPQAVFIPLFVQ